VGLAETDAHGLFLLSPQRLAEVRETFAGGALAVDERLGGIQDKAK
jgi:hypothetical protein